MQIPAIIGRFYFDYDKEQIPSFFSTILSATAITLLVFTGLVISIGDELVGFVFPKAALPFFPLFFLALISVAISSLARVASTLLQVQKKATLLLRLSSIVAVVHFAVSLLLVVGLEWGPVGVLTAMVVSGSVNLVIVTFAVRDYLTLDIQTKHISPELKYCLPLIPHFYGGFLFVASDKIVLEKFVSLAELGIYAVAVKLCSPLSIFVEAFNRSISPRFFEASKASKENAVGEFREIITKWFAIAVSLWLGFCVFAQEAVYLLTPPSYHGATVFLSILAASYLFRGLYCFAVNPLFYEKKTNWIPVITLIAGIANVGLNIYLIPKYGVIVAAWTTLFSYALTFVLAFSIAKFIYPLSWDFGRLLFIGLSSCGLVLLAEQISIDSLVPRIVAKSLLLLMGIVVLGLAGKILTRDLMRRLSVEFKRVAVRSDNQ